MRHFVPLLAGRTCNPVFKRGGEEEGYVYELLLGLWFLNGGGKEGGIALPVHSLKTIQKEISTNLIFWVKKTFLLPLYRRRIDFTSTLSKLFCAGDHLCDLGSI